MSDLTRESILQFKRSTQAVTLGNRGTAYVRELLASEVLTWSDKSKANQADAVDYLVTTATVDAAGNPIFTEADAASIKSLPYSVTEPIVKAALTLSGIATPDAEKKAAAAS